MKPDEYWKYPYREMVLFCEANSIRQIENFKHDIIIQEAVSNKLIQADGMNKRPKVVLLKKMFKEIFK